MNSLIHRLLANGMAALLLASISYSDHLGHPLDRLSNLHNLRATAWNENGPKQELLVLLAHPTRLVAYREFSTTAGSNEELQATSKQWLAAPVWKTSGEPKAVTAALKAIHDPADLAIDGQGNFFVSDRSNGQIWRISAKGDQTQTWGRLGSGPDELNQPSGLTLIGEQLWVADSGNRRLSIWGTTGEHLQNFPGESPLRTKTNESELPDSARPTQPDRTGQSGQPVQLTGYDAPTFIEPVAIDVDRRGTLYVLDRGAHRVWKFDNNGQPQGSWGGFGSFTGLLSYPSDLVVADGRAFICEAGNHRVSVFSLQGDLLYMWGGLPLAKGTAGLSQPIALAVTSDRSHAALCEPLRNSCSLFGRDEDLPAHDDHTGDHLRMKRSDSAQLLAQSVGGNWLAAVDFENCSVPVFNVERVGPVQVTTLGRYGQTPGEFLEPSDVWVHSDRAQVFVTDRLRRNLQVFALHPDLERPFEMDASMGRFVKALDFEQLSDASLPCSPLAIACGAEQIYVADGANQRILVCDEKLRPTGQSWGSRGSRPGQFLRPTDLAWNAAREELWVLDPLRNAVVILNKTGQLVRELNSPFASEQSTEAWEALDCLAIAHDGRALVSSRTNSSLRLIEANGDLRSLALPDSGPPQYQNPAALCHDPRGFWFTADRGLRRGQVLSLDGRFVVAY